MATVHAERAFVAYPESAAAARAFVREVAPEIGPMVDLDTALLVTTELVSNVILHASSDWLTVVIDSAGPSVMRVTVSDSDPAHPIRKREVGAGEPHGRGLEIVDRLARAWGVDDLTGDGKRAWVEVGPERSASP